MEKELAQSDITVRGKVPKTTQNFTFLKKIVFSGGFGDFFLIMIDGEVKLKLFRQGMDKDEKDGSGWVTPDYIKRIREWKSNNINSSNIKDNKKENIDNKKENVISTSKFDPFGTDSDSY